jgi:CubicO group peptidase (beta-lactamase class C family)
MSDSWPVSTPAQQTLDPKLICATGPSLAKLTGANPHGVVVVRNGVLVYEQYFAGDDRHGSTPLFVVPHDANTLHHMESITKGVVALLVGIGFDRGWLKSLDTPVITFVPEYADLRSPDKDKITVRHLLSMTSGLDWPERAISGNNPENIVRRGYNASDPYRFVLERSVEASPGTAWNYNGGGVWLLGLILRKVSGQPLDGFAKDALFEALGIEEWEWGRFANGDPGHVRWIAPAPARFGQARPTRAGQRCMAGAADRLRRLDQPDDRSAKPAGGSRSGHCVRMVTYGGKADHQSITTRLIGSARLDAVGSASMWCPG